MGTTPDSERRAPLALTLSRRRLLQGLGALTLGGGAAVGAGTAYAVPATGAVATTPPPTKPLPPLPTRAAVVAELGHRKPKHFGMFLAGAVTRGNKHVALTFDACGGPRGSGYDKAVVETLRKAHVPATLFLNARWIATNPGLAAELAADPLFELGNHGWHHCPLTVRGQKAYGIAGTRSAGEAYDEIVHGLDAVAGLTGTRPLWYRPGTAYADDVGLAVARRLGLRVASYSVNADAGATASQKSVAKNLAGLRSRDVSLGHFNHPEGKTAEGLAKALPGLLHRGTRFVTLSAATA